MFNFLKKLMNNSKGQQISGVFAVDMSLNDLKQLCKENNLDIKGLTTKEKILKVIKDWEKNILNKTDSEIKSRGATATKRVEIMKEAEPEEEIHENSKVVSKSEVELNGRKYTEIKVKRGITYRVPKNK